MSPRIIPLAARDLARTYEGLRLDAYRDVADVLTIGYGHTGRDVHEGQVITEAEADLLLDHDLAIAGLAVERLVTVPMTEGQFAALVDFTFNLGAGRLHGSTLLHHLNEGLPEAAAAQFPRWSHGGGAVLEGLLKRRLAEKALFETPNTEA
jgi:lysozyme